MTTLSENTQITMTNEPISLYGPIEPIPEDYKPRVLITDEQFEAICEKSEKPTAEEKFFGRDYAVDQFLRCIRKAHAGDYRSTDEVLMELPDKRLKDLFSGLDSCSCCWRHCHKTPVSHDSWEDRSQLGVATEEMVSERNCFCYCRLAKRSIRRAFFSKPDAGRDSPLEYEEE
jgi:hypothetical protein